MQALALADVVNAQPAELLDTAPPALRRAVLRGRQAGNGDDIGSFNSFIDPPSA